MVRVILYKSGDEGADKAAREALTSAGFVTRVSPCPAELRNTAPGPVAHFCGKGVIFGKEGILSFANRLQREEKAPKQQGT